MSLSNCDILLDDPGLSKLGVIKVIREQTGLGLQEAKYFVDNAPCMIVYGLSEEEARRFVKNLAEAGATATILRSDGNAVNTRTADDARSIADERRELNQKLLERGKEIDKSNPSGCMVWGLSFLGVIWLFSQMGASGSSGWIIFFTIVVAIVVFIALGSSKQEKLNNYSASIAKEQEKKRSEMESVLDDAKSKGFIITGKVTDPSNNYCIALDKTHKAFLVKYRVGTSYKVFEFSSLIDFEISQDGMTTLSSKMGEAVVGGVLFGATGAVVGASGKRNVDEYCSSLYLTLTLDSESDLRIQIPFITSKTAKSSDKYRGTIERAEEMVSLLKVIQSSPKETVEQKAHNTSKTEISKISEEKVTEIKMYKSLLDDGIITMEEYEAKRKELLNL